MEEWNMNAVVVIFERVSNLSNRFIESEMLLMNYKIIYHQGDQEGYEGKGVQLKR